jgi:glutamate:GABA antiporter
VTAVASETETTTAAALEEKTKLQKHFGRFDMFFFLVCTLVGLDTIGTVASNGAQGFTWLIFLAPVFFLPYAFLTAELGSTFTDEGGPYVWTKLALGRFVAGVNALIYWISNPIWLGGTLTITAVATFDSFFTDLGSWKYLFGLIFIWTSVWAAILSFGIGKWLPTIGAWGRMLVLGFFTLTVVIYAIKHGVHGVHGGSFKPTYVVFIALVPVLFFNYVGFELPNAAGDEMKDPQKDVPYTVIRSAIMAVVLYGAPILAILLILPLNQVTHLGGFIDAIKTVFTVYGGHVGATPDQTTLTGAGKVIGDLGAVLFIFALMSSGATWIMGADRAQAVACYDGAGPRILGRFSRRYGTPIAVNFLSGLIATLLMLLAFKLTSGSNAKYFGAALGLAISTTTISYLAIFPALYLLRRKLPNVHRPYRVPWGETGALVISVLTFGWAALATAVLLWPGLGQANPDAALVGLGFPHQRWQYEASQFIPLAVFLALGLLFYVLGAPTRRKEVVVTLAPAATAPAGRT